MQSLPVSPPPMTMTCLPSARICGSSFCDSPATRRFCCGRKAMANTRPSRSRPGEAAKKSNGCSDPPASSSASCPSSSSLRRDGPAHVRVAVEDDALRLHLLHAPLDDVLLHLEVGDAVGEEPARLGALLVDVHLVAGARQLLGGGEAGRAGADDGDLLAGLPLRRLRRDPALCEGPVGDGALDGLDGDRVVVDVERAGGLARRRAHAPRHLREVVGGVQVDAPPPASGRDRRGRSSPGSDCSPDSRCGSRGCRSPCSARACCLDLGRRQRLDELAPMLHALVHGPVSPVLAVELHEARDLAHRGLSGALQRSVDRGSGAAQMYVGIVQEGPMKVEKWGDELAIRLSAEVVELMDLKEGDEVDIGSSAPTRSRSSARGEPSACSCACASRPALVAPRRD